MLARASQIFIAGSKGQQKIEDMKSGSLTGVRSFAVRGYLLWPWAITKCNILQYANFLGNPSLFAFTFQGNYNICQTKIDTLYITLPAVWNKGIKIYIKLCSQNIYFLIYWWFCDHRISFASHRVSEIIIPGQMNPMKYKNSYFNPELRWLPYSIQALSNSNFGQIFVI